MAEEAKQTLEEAMQDGWKPSAEKMWQGSIEITLYRNAPPEAKFLGEIRGHEISIAWRGMMREYRKWKHSLMSAEDRKLGGT